MRFLRTRLRAYLLLAFVGCLLTTVSLVVLLPRERVTRANLEKIELDMSQAGLHGLLGPPDYQTVELGMVNGPNSYSTNFGDSAKELRLRGYRDYTRQQWHSPEITIITISDAEGRVVCKYSGEGQRRVNAIDIVWYWLRRLF